jgi:hypothetical protein
MDLNHDLVAASGEERLAEGLVADGVPPPPQPTRKAAMPRTTPNGTSLMRLRGSERRKLGNSVTTEL